MRTANPELAEQRRQQILQAAGACFVTKGFHQTSVAEIARAATISMGLLYRYFPNKEAIVRAFAEQDRQQLSTALIELQNAADLSDGLSAFVDGIFESLKNQHDQRIASEVLAECGRNAALLASVQNEDALSLAAVQNTLKQLAKRGLVSKRGVTMESAVLMVALFEGISVRLTLNSKLDQKKLKAATMEALLQLLA